jgi:hypothetical protein
MQVLRQARRPALGLVQHPLHSLSLRARLPDVPRDRPDLDDKHERDEPALLSSHRSMLGSLGRNNAGWGKRDATRQLAWPLGRFGFDTPDTRIRVANGFPDYSAVADPA